MQIEPKVKVFTDKQTSGTLNFASNPLRKTPQNWNQGSAGGKIRRVMSISRDSVLACKERRKRAAPFCSVSQKQNNRVIDGLCNGELAGMRLT